MDTKTYFIAYGVFLLTLVLAFLFVSVPYYQAKWENTGQSFDFKKFWKSSWNVNIGNLIIGILFLFVYNLVIDYFKLESTKEVLYGLCIFLASFGCTAIFKKWGGAQKYFEKWVDTKLPVDNE